MRSDEFSGLWHRQWPECPPLSYELKHAYPDRWVRFHSLPESERYARTADEYGIVLDRYNTVLDELFTGQDVYLITCDWTDRPEPESRPPEHAQLHPGARYWTTVCDGDTDPGFCSYTHLYISRIPWQRGGIDDLLLASADYATGGAMITDLAMKHVHAPYDGGADVLVPTTVERDILAHRHTHWLSRHPGGL